VSAKKRETLLPVNHTLDHDGRSLRIVQRLKAGLTGEVYRGELASEDTPAIPVAIKVMKALEFPMARQLFAQESETLSFMMHLEEQADREQRLSLKVAPRYYGRGDYEGTPYMVMEFISGQEIPALLKEKEKLPEAQALTLAWHLYRTLDVMHTRLKKTYLDLKFEDLWWVADGGGNGQLKLTDFGTLEDLKPEDPQQRGVRRDLLLSGVYLCAMLTGRTLGYSLGELRERAEPVIRQAEISWGTRQLLRRLLHRNPAVRPVSAAAVSAELRTLVNFWSQPPEKLIQAAEANLTHAETESEPPGPQTRDYAGYAGRARAALDIARLRLPEEHETLSADIQRAEKILSLSDYLNRGQGLFKGRSYAQARRVFEEGMHWSDDPAHLRRWAYLARIGEDISPTVFDQHREAALQALERINEADWAHAVERLKSLQPALQSPGLDALQADTQAFGWLDRAEQEKAQQNFKEAAKAYRQAVIQLDKLPEADFIRKEEVGDLSRLAEEMEQWEKTRGQAQARMAQAAQKIEAGNFDQAVTLAQEAFALDRENPHWLEELQRLAEAALAKFKFTAALALSEIGARGSPPGQRLLLTFSLAAQLSAAEQALRNVDREAFLTALNRVRTEFSSQPTALPALEHLFNRAVNLTRETGDSQFLRALANFADQIGWSQVANEQRRIAGEIETRDTGRLSETTDRLLATATDLLALDDPTRLAEATRGRTLADLLVLLRNREARLAQAAQLLGDAAAVAPDEGRREKIAALQARITPELNTVRERAQAQQRVTEAERSQRLNALNADWRRIKARRDWANRVEEVGAEAGVREQLEQQLGNDLREMILKCYAFLAQVDAKDSAVGDLLEQATAELDRLGAFAWQPLQRLAAEQAERFRAEVREAQTAFKNGQATQTAERLASLLPQAGGDAEWLDLKFKLIGVESFRAWQTEQAAALAAGQPDPILLKTLRGYVGLNLPALYWSESSALAYARQVRSAARQSTKEALPSFSRPEFVNHLRAWLEAEMTARLAGQVLNGHKPDAKRRWSSQATGWKAESFLTAAAVAGRSEKAIQALETLLETTATPPDLDAALKELTPEAWKAALPRAINQERRKQQSQVLALVALGLGLFALGFIAAGMIYNSDRNRYQQIAFGTFTPTSTYTPTRTPTSTSTPTPTWTPTITPTPILAPSTFLMAEPAAIYPLVPLGAEAVWLINDEQAIVDPPLTDKTIWTGSTSTDQKANQEHFFYTNTGGATVTWKMDTPLYEGLYQIYVLDMVERSAGPQDFKVMLDEAIATPYRGQSMVIFNSSLVGKQKSDDWVSLGAYEVRTGQTLTVRAEIGPRTADSPFAVDRVLIVKVSEAQRQILEALPPGRTLASLLDDAHAKFYELTGGGPVPVSKPWTPVTDAPAWNGSFSTRNQAWVVPVQVYWAPIGRLPAGEYELYAWIPSQHATVIADYALLADGQEVKRTPAEIVQKKFSGEWVSLGTWKLEAEAAVTVRMTIPTVTVKPENQGGEIGADAVALLRVGN
jgi:serine/threonine protein kinase